MIALIRKDEGDLSTGSPYTYAISAECMTIPFVKQRLGDRTNEERRTYPQGTAGFVAEVV